jgi:hypothetical protein
MTEKNTSVSVVFAKLDYSHSTKDTGNVGTTTTILGIASSPEVAHQMIVVDHLNTVQEEGLNVLKHPLKPVFVVDTNDNMVDGYSVTISGQDGDTHWVNTISWYAVKIETDTLLEHFEL